jgi:uncharacterized membrane protein
MNKNRLEAFSDGVFAIVITLLVLEIKVPKVPANELKHALYELLPKYFSFALSFVIIGVYWVSHHNMMHFIEKTDRVSLWLNMLVLFTICIIPFPTALMGDYPDSSISILVYGSTLASVNLSGGLFWAYCTKNNRLCNQKLNPKFSRKITRLHLSPCLLYIAAVLLSMISNKISYAIFIGVPLFFIIPNKLLIKFLSNDNLDDK